MCNKYIYFSFLGIHKSVHSFSNVCSRYEWRSSEYATQTKANHPWPEDSARLFHCICITLYIYIYICIYIIIYIIYIYVQNNILTRQLTNYKLMLHLERLRVNSQLRLALEDCLSYKCFRHTAACAVLVFASTFDNVFQMQVHFEVRVDFKEWYSLRIQCLH